LTALRSLVIAPQWIGDAVMTEPLLARLAQQGQVLTVAALPWVAPVFRAMPQVTAVIELPFQHGGLQWQARRELGRRLRGQFDCAYVLPNSAKSALIPFFARIPVRVGYQGEMRWGLLNRRLPSPAKSQRPPMVPFYTALADVAVLPGASVYGVSQVRAQPRLRVSAEHVAAVLAANGLQTGQFIVFAPGAEFGSAKRWPAAHFSRLAQLLPVPVVLLGSGKELPLCETIVHSSSGSVASRLHNLAGKTSLEDAFALISSAQAVVSNDSGLMHVAAGLGVPQVALFGSSSPLHTPPLNESARVVWLKQDEHYLPALDCAPCFQRECPLGHTRCLNDISPERVLALIENLGKAK
jgi:heptosyltransferase-2